MGDALEVGRSPGGGWRRADVWRAASPWDGVGLGRPQCGPEEAMPEHTRRRAAAAGRLEMLVHIQLGFEISGQGHWMRRGGTPPCRLAGHARLVDDGVRLRAPLCIQVILSEQIGVF